MNSLAGMTILVTRPPPLGEELCQILQQKSAEVIYYPTIAIESLTHTLAFQEAITAAGEQNWLVFISPQAVFTSVPMLRKVWPNFPPELKIAAIGKGTAKALHDAGYIASLVPETWDSEGLLSMPQLQHLSNQRIAIIKGKGGREVLSQTLRARGARVTEILAYERKLPSAKPHFSISKLDATLCSSYEGVVNLLHLLPKEQLSTIIKVPLLVPSERIKVLARDLGFQTIWVTHKASHQAYFEKLEELRNQAWPKTP